jgi:hypothetical protein
MQTISAATNGQTDSTVYLLASKPNRTPQKPARKRRTPAGPCLTLACSPERAQGILAAEGRWPRRPAWWPAEEAAHDFYVIAAMQSLLDSPRLIEAAMAEYLG